MIYVYEVYDVRIQKRRRSGCMSQHTGTSMQLYSCTDAPVAFLFFE